jgi:Tol biopolymer transport system component
MTARVLAVAGFALLAAAGSAGAKADPPTALAYASDARGSLDVYVVAAGSNARPRRRTASGRDEFSPAWSPDGRWIAYRVNPQRSDVGEIWVMRADGTRKRNLTRSRNVADWSPSWSPDGRLIAYFSTAGGGGDVWVMRTDGSGKRNVTRDGRLNEYPTWSPDGRRLAFNSHRDGQFEIYATGIDGSRQVNLTRNPAQDQWPAWLPDGTLIA